MDIRFKFFWSESFGQIFPALKSLSASGLVEEIEIKEKLKHSQKKTYRITEHGLAALHEWLKHPVERESFRLEILLKMYFSHFVDAEVMLGHVMKFQEAHEQELQVLNMFQLAMPFAGCHHSWLQDPGWVKGFISPNSEYKPSHLPASPARNAIRHAQ